jgi:hypothetical protein
MIGIAFLILVVAFNIALVYVMIRDYHCWKREMDEYGQRIKDNWQFLADTLEKQANDRSDETTKA